MTLPGGDLLHRMARARRPRADDRPGGVRVRRQVRSGAVRRRRSRVMSVEVVTFGCRLNAYESEVIRREAEAAGVANAVVVNTCAVTAEAVRQSRQAIRKLEREHPGAHVLVTGCAAQTEPDTFADMPEVALVLGNEEKLSAEFWRAHRDACVAVRARPRRKSRGQRHHGGDRDRRAPGRRPRRAARAPSCRCRTAAITAAPSASSRMAAAIRARCRWARWWRRCAASSGAAIARSCSPASISPATDRTCRARRSSARW